MGQNKKPSTDEILEASKLLEKIMGIDLDKLEVERVEQLRPVDRLIEDLKNDKKLRRGPGNKGLPKRPRKKVHWREKRRRERAYYHAKTKPKKLERKIEMLKTGEGWWTWITRKWRGDGIECFSKEEWMEHVWPHVEGRVPYVTRYDTGKGYTLENVLVREDQTGTVLFDGTEHKMRRLGYIY